jgi:large subunit ribosomal protein L10
MARPEKEALVAEFKQYFDDAQSVYVADYQGLNVGLISELRARFRAEGVKIRVAKNTLVRRAMEAAGQKDLSEILTGPNAFIFGYDDPVVPARIIREFKKKARVNKPEVRGFVIEGQYIPGDQFDRYADIPSKTELVARLVGSVQSPLANLVFTMQAILREFVGTVAALGDARGDGKGK